MKLLDLTLPSLAENLALDEALLEAAERGEQEDEVLRLWQPATPMVVLGRSSPLTAEVNVEYCRANNIPINRRCSGGQTIVTGTGCLMYGVLLDYRQRPELKMLDKAHRFVLQKIAIAIKRLGIEVAQQGTSDLTIGSRKFSGNSLRCKRNWMIYHGTLLYDFDLSVVSKCLGNPIRRPKYRGKRKHEEFLTQLPVTREQLEGALIAAWSAGEPITKIPMELAKELAKEKYRLGDWVCRVS